VRDASGPTISNIVGVPAPIRTAPSARGGLQAAVAGSWRHHRANPWAAVFRSLRKQDDRECRDRSLGDHCGIGGPAGVLVDWN
jgi:hypothetical protein